VDIAQAGCRAALTTVSQSIWPTMAALSACDTKQTTFAGIPLESYCNAQGLTYSVLWRSAVGGPYFINILRGESTLDTDREFTLTGSSGVLGSTVRGYRLTDAQEFVYDCAWEYADYPVAMVIEGADFGTTAAACEQARFYNNDRMAVLFA
jgi:hypothetical protein